MTVEIVKQSPEEFGGLQFEILTPHQMAFRYCAAAGCSFPGRMQMPIPRVYDSDPKTWRLLCNQHFVQLIFLMDAFLGSPSPASEATMLAEALGLVGDPLRKWKNSMAVVFNPEFARCATCGGGFVAEVIGMYSGKRYVHTCGVPK